MLVREADAVQDKRQKTIATFGVVCKYCRYLKVTEEEELVESQGCAGVEIESSAANGG